MVGHARRKAALIAHRSAQAPVMEDLLERLKGLGAIAHRFPKCGRTHRDDHEFLNVEIVVGMRAAVDDIHHRHRQGHRTRTAEIAIERQSGLFGRSLGNRHRHRQRCVGAESGLVVGTVEFDQDLVDIRLLAGVEAHDRLGNLGVDVLDRTQHTFATVTRRIAIAQFDRLARAGRGPGWHGCTAHRARFKQYIAFDRGVAAGIDHLTSDNVDNRAHWFRFLLR